MASLDQDLRYHKNAPGTAICHGCGQVYEHSTGVLEDDQRPELGRYEIQFHEETSSCRNIIWYNTDHPGYPEQKKADGKDKAEG